MRDILTIEAILSYFRSAMPICIFETISVEMIMNIENKKRHALQISLRGTLWRRLE